MKYRLNTGTLKLPEDWEDETLYIFKAPKEQGFNLVINNNPLPPDTLPEDFIIEQTKVLCENLPEYKENKKGLLASSKPYQVIDYDWMSPEGKVYQVNMMVVVENILLSFTFSSTRPYTEKRREIIRDILMSYEF